MFETEGLQHVIHGFPSALFEKPIHIFRQKFDTGHHPVHPDTALAEAQIMKILFRLFHHAKLVFRNGFPVYETGCQTCKGRFVPGG